MPEQENRDDIAVFIGLITFTLIQSARQAYVIGEMQAQGYLPNRPFYLPYIKARAKDYAERYAELLQKEGATMYGDKRIEWLANYEQRLRTEIERIISEGARSGKPIGTPNFEEGTIAGDLKKYLLDEQEYYLSMVTQTEMVNVRNNAMDARYKSAGVEYVRRHLGPRPCPICAPHRGVIYRIGTQPFLPIHPNCMDWYEPIKMDEKGRFVSFY